jgi:hypothetical protein
MADQGQTTTLVVVAAVVVVAVLWSRRASAATSGGRPPGSAGGAMPPTAGPDYGSILSGAGSLFNGIANLADQVFSSDEDSIYTIPGQAPTRPSEQTSFIGDSCSEDFNCGFGERCAGGVCVPETAALPTSDEFAFV